MISGIVALKLKIIIFATGIGGVINRTERASQQPVPVSYFVGSSLKLAIMENEIWKDVPGYAGTYQVSNFGRVKSLRKSIESGFKERIFIYFF
ncbi:MAG: NUMOD4 domain-containing protein [Alphaproteobacteria bacterium]